MAPDTLDPQLMFRYGTCFEYSGAFLSNTTTGIINFLVATGQLAHTPAPAREDSQTPGGIWLPGSEAPPVAAVSIKPETMAQIPTVIPMLVLHAFATEVYLKCLLVLEGKDIPRHHELQRLFQDLPPERQARVVEGYRIECDRDEQFGELQRTEPGTAFTLDYSLSEMNKAFEAWRYAYESGVPEKSFLGRPWLAVKRAILEVKPEWQSIVKNLGTPPTSPFR